MAHNIHESLLPLAVDIDQLVPLDGNPRRGDIDAIASSYAEFGQIKPIVVKPNGDGTFIIIAGNHQFEAAKKLGWDKIAVVQYDVDDKRAIAFALADNRTMELGYTEPELLNEMVMEISDYYPELMDGLGWDEFELAELEQRSIRQDSQLMESGSYVPPVLLSQPGSVQLDNPDDFKDEDEDQESINNQPLKPTLDRNAVSVTRDRDGQQHLSARSGVDQNDAVVRGSTTVSPGSAPQAIVQVNIVFDNPDQQRFWYDFIKYIRSNPDIKGVTTAEKIINFIANHMNNQA